MAEDSGCGASRAVPFGIAAFVILWWALYTRDGSGASAAELKKQNSLLLQQSRALKDIHQEVRSAAAGVAAAQAAADGARRIAQDTQRRVEAALRDGSDRRSAPVPSPPALITPPKLPSRSRKHQVQDVPISDPATAQQKYLYKCNPRVHCLKPNYNNEPCQFVPVPVVQGVTIPEKEKYDQGGPDGKGWLKAENILRREVFDALSDAGAFKNKIALNFGAWLQGRDQLLWYDTATGLMTRRGWSGHSFDSASHLTHLRNLLTAEKNGNVTLHSELLTSRNVVQYLKKLDLPITFDFLKVDIDSYDCDLAEAILKAGYRPTMLQTEMSPHWPPGVRAVSRLGGSPVTASGCSCAGAVELGRRYGYRLISAFGIDVTMIRASELVKLGDKIKLHEPTYCSPACGSAYCRQEGGVCRAHAESWLKDAENGDWDKMTLEAATGYAKQGWVGEVSSDFGALRVTVDAGGSIQKSMGPIEYEMQGDYAVPVAQPQPAPQPLP